MTAGRPRWGRAGALLAGLAALAAAGHLGLLDLRAALRGMANLGRFTRDLFPPNLDPLPTLAAAMLETVEIAYTGTVAGFALALPAAVIASRAVYPTRVSRPVRLGLAAIRTVPSLLWAVIFVVAIGLGPAAGTLGIAAYTLGYLGKLLYEAFDGVDAEVLEGVRSVGCSRPQLVRFALLPEAANAVLSQLLFVFEYNVRASSIIGFVGAGGIGFYMLGYVQLLQYRNLLTALVLTLIVVLAIEWASGRLRERVISVRR